MKKQHNSGGTEKPWSVLEAENKLLKAQLAQLLGIERSEDVLVEIEKQNQIQYKLNERIKELNFHKSVSELFINNGQSLETIFRKIVQLIPAAFQYSNATECCINIGSQSYTTPNFIVTTKKIEQDIVLNTKVIGKIEVCYPGDFNPENKLFIPEERDLLFNLATRITAYLERSSNSNELFETRNKYQHLIENVNDIIYEYDTQGILTYISPVVEKNFGFSPNEIIGKNFIHFVGRDVDFMSHILVQLKDGNVTNSEYQISAKNGEKRWIQLSTRGVFEGSKFKGGAGILTDITSRKRIEIERNRSEQLYRSILTASPDTITITDLNGQILFTSPSANRMFGYDSTFDFSKLSIFDFIDKEFHLVASNAIAAMFGNKYSGADEYIGIKADGEKFYIEVNAEFIRNENDEPVNLVFVTRDITQRKLSDEKLSKIQNSYKKLVENINDILYEIDKNGVIQYISPNIEKLTGYAVTDIVGKNFMQFSGQYIDSILSRIVDIAQKDYVVSEYKVQKKDGDFLWLRFSTKAAIENGEFVGASGTLIDITANKQVELELQKSESLYSTILTASPDAITIVDLKGEIIFASHVNHNIFGYENSYDFTGHSFYEYIDPTVAEEIHNYAVRLFQGEEIGMLTYKGLRQDGSMFDLEVNARVITDENSNPTNALFVVRDISERKKLEENLKKSEDKYKKLVENINEIIYEIDSQGIVKYVSPAIRRMGYEPEEMIGLSFLKFTGANTDFLYQNLLRLKKGELITSEYQVPAKNGRLHWIRFSTKAIYDESSQFVGGTGTLVDVTYSKTIKLKLQKSEELYRTLVERINDVVFEVLNDGTIKYVSPAIQKVLGYDVKEITGTNFFEYMYPDDIPMLKAAFADLHNVDSSHLEYRYCKKDGSICWVRSTTRAVIIDGKLTGGIGVLTNIHERKLAEEKLIKSEEKYRSIFETVQDAYYEATVDGILLDISPSIYNLSYGQLSREELIGKSLLNYYHNENERTVLFQKLAVDAKVIDYEITFYNKDGSLVPISISSTLVKDEQGNPVKVTGSMRNISERKKAEKQIQESQALYRSILEASPDAISITDLTGNVQFVSPKTLTMFGYDSIEQFKNRSLYDFVIPEEHNDIQDILVNMYQKTERFATEHKAIRADGSIFDVEVNAEFIRDYQNNPISMVLIIRDITERKHVAELIRVSEEKYRLMFEQNPQPMWIYDLETLAILEVNEVSVQQYGYSREEFLQMTIKDIRPQEDVDDLLQDIEHITINKTSNRNVWRHLWKNNELRFVEVNAQFVDFNGRKARHVLINDITERLLTENSLKESERKFRSITEQTSDLIAIADTNGFISYASSSSYKLFNSAPDEMIGKNFLSFVSESEIARAEKEFRRVLEKRSIIKNAIYLMKRSNGTIFSAELNGSLFMSESFNGVLFTIRDISERIEAEKEIKNKTNVLTNLIINLKEGILLENSNREIVLTNQLFCDMFNILAPANALIGADCSQSAEQSKHLFVDPEKFLSDINIILKYKIAVFNDVLQLVDGRYFERDYIPTFQDGVYSGHLWKYRDITERTQALKKLAMSEERFRQVVDQSKEVVWEMDANGLYTFVSSAAKDVYGYLPEEMIGKLHFYDIAPESIRDQFKKEAMEAFSQKIKFNNYLNKIERADSSINILLTTGIPILDDYGNLLGYRGLDANITEQKRAEQELLKFRTITDEANYGAMIVSIDGVIQYVNNTMSQMLRWEQSELLGKTLSVMHNLSQSEKLNELQNKIIHEGGFVSEELVHVRKDGSEFPAIVNAKLITDENGGDKFISSTIIDISIRKANEQKIKELNDNLEIKIAERTAELEKANQTLTHEINARKRIEDALLQSEYQYRSVVENINEVIFETDNDGLWLFLNHSWEQITGFNVNESLGKFFLNYVHPDDREINMSFFEPLISKKKDHCRHEVRYLTKAGGYRWVEVFAKLAVNEDGEATGTYGSLQDITERKLAEDFENEMLQLSAQITAISASETDLAVNVSLTRIAKFLQADRSYIFEIHSSGDIMSNTYEWCNEGITAEIDNLKDLPLEIFPVWMEKMRAHQNVIIPSVGKLTDEWKNEREILEPQGVKSLIALPMIYENQFIGFVGLDSVVSYREYSQAELNILKVWSSMLSTLIINKRNESLLEIARQNFETFFNTVDDFLWVLDQEGKIIHINQTVVERLNYTPQELENKSILLVHPVQRRAEAERIVAEMLRSESDFCPVPLVNKSGELIPVETRVKFGYWNGQPAIFGVSKDISKLQISEQKFSKAFQSGSAIMAISDFETGEYIDVNKTFSETLGYSWAELKGKSDKVLRLFVDTSLRNGLIQKMQQNIPVRDMEALIRTKDNQHKTILLSADIIFVGERKCLLTVSVDITARKSAEEEIKLARIEAENANIAKSEFLSRMSHELRTPMNSILGFAQLLEMSELNNAQIRAVNHILHSGKHLLELINEVLDISRIEAGRLSLSIEPVNANDILREMMDVIQPLAAKNNISIVSTTDKLSKVYVKADKQKLKQILLNLLNNAIKYNKPNGSIMVDAFEVEERNTLRILIKDTGIGISPEKLPKVFTPFERVGADRTQIEGTGLGLAVVQKLIEALGGTIGVESTPDVGSTFWIELQRDESQLEKFMNSNSITSIDVADIEKIGTILYIEDNDSNIELVQQILTIQRPSIKLIWDKYGANALKLALLHQPKMILLDMNLPDIQGDEVLETLKQHPQTSQIPVIVISADAMPKQIDKMLQAGARRYMTKPLDVVTFLETIDKYNEYE